MLRLMFLVPFALALAIAAGALFLLVAAVADPLFGNIVAVVLETGWWSLFDALVDADGGGLPRLDGAFAAAGKIAFALLVLPPLAVALVSEAIGARSFVWQIGATALITGAMPFLARGVGRAPSPEEMHIAFVLFLAGAVSGAVYWLIAGRRAGLRQREEARMRSANAENRPAKE